MGKERGRGRGVDVIGWKWERGKSRSGKNAFEVFVYTIGRNDTKVAKVGVLLYDQTPLFVKF